MDEAATEAEVFPPFAESPAHLSQVQVPGPAPVRAAVEVPEVPVGGALVGCAWGYKMHLWILFRKDKGGWLSLSWIQVHLVIFIVRLIPCRSVVARQAIHI